MSPNRTLDEVRETILAMPFAQVMHFEITNCGDDTAAVSMPLSDAATHDGAAFSAPAVAALADAAAAAATLASLPPNQMAATTGIDVQVTASTRGTRLSARAVLHERIGSRLTFVVEVDAHRPDGSLRPCGTGAITIKVLDPAG